MSGYSKKVSDVWVNRFEYERYFSNFVVNWKFGLDLGFEREDFDYLILYKENRPSEDFKEIKREWDLKMTIIEEGWMKKWHVQAV